jgi:hypothetical protein
MLRTTHSGGKDYIEKRGLKASVLNLKGHVNRGKLSLLEELISFLSFFDLDIVHNVRNHE